MHVSSTIRVGVIGTGVGVRTYAPSVMGSESMELIGVVGSTTARTREHLRNAGVPVELARTWVDLLDLDPDLICITTPVDKRIEYIASLAGFGGHLMLEKPAITRTQAGPVLLDALGPLASRTFINFQLRGVEAFQFVRQSVSSGRLGRIYSISLFEHSASLKCANVPEWMLHTRTGGGQMFSMGTHLLDLGLFLCDLTYEQADHIAPAGYAETVLGEWSDDARDDISDEAFGFWADINGCHIMIETSAISEGPREIGFRVEAEAGSADFLYRDGRGELRVWYADGESCVFALGAKADLVGLEAAPPRLNPSLFRVAHPRYMETIANAVRGDKNGAVARVEEGIMNSTLLCRSIRK